MKLSDNQSFGICAHKPTKEVGIMVAHLNEAESLHSFFITKEQWEELKEKVDAKFDELGRRVESETD